MLDKKHFVLSALALVGLSACHQTPKHTDDILTSPWTPPTRSAQEKLYTSEPLYCYATLGTPECYHMAQVTFTDRLQGYFSPLSKQAENFL